MSKFDGILMCSDIDGTFSGAEGTIETNSEAIKYFTDNGGKFTFSTGRPVGYVRKQEFISILNAPVCLYNGGMVYDYENERILLEERLNITVQEFISVMSKYNDAITEFYIFDNCEQDYIFFPDFTSVTEEAYLLKPIKVIFLCKDAEIANEIQLFAQQHEVFNQCCIAKSDPLTVEFNSINASKGKALTFIKNYLGNIHTAIGVGDNENDVSMIQDADVGVAVGNAPESVKQTADLVVKPCNEYGIKDLIEIIEKHPECLNKKQ